MTRTALERRLDVRKDLVQRAHGTTRLWVSLWMNHDGVLDDDGHTTIRPPGMPLEENGLVRGLLFRILLQRGTIPARAGSRTASGTS
ncbi:hypothetical protein ACWIGY_20215 [Streptomyces anulatus]